jgi:short-subunit dehydrogenase
VYGAPVDILVNNAGLSSRSSVLTTAVETDATLMQVNWMSAVALTKSVREPCESIHGACM